jgi:hypothetical protein
MTVSPSAATAQLSNEDMMDNFCHMIIEEYLTRKQLKATLETFREESVLFHIYLFFIKLSY